MVVHQLTIINPPLPFATWEDPELAASSLESAAICTARAVWSKLPWPRTDGMAWDGASMLVFQQPTSEYAYIKICMFKQVYCFNLFKYIYIYKYLQYFYMYIYIEFYVRNHDNTHIIYDI